MIKFFSGFGDSNEKELRRLQPLVDKTNELEADFEKLSDDELRAKTSEFRSRLKDAIVRTCLYRSAISSQRSMSSRVRARPSI